MNTRREWWRWVMVSGVVVAMASGCTSSRVEPGVVVELAGYSEGIVFDAAGAAFVSVQHHETVRVVHGSGASEDWYRTKVPNGHKVLPDGTHLVAARGGVHHVGADGTLIEVLAPEIVTPNDLALDGDGGFYVTAPAEAGADRDAMRSGVYYIDSARVVRKAAGDFCYPNGIAVRADGKSLVVNDSCNRRVYEFQISAPGVLTGRRLFAELADLKSVPDGMAFDRAGLLYIADYGAGVVVVLDQAGLVVRTYPTGLRHASNVAFGGEGCEDLYVTGSVGQQAGAGRLVVLPIGVEGRRGLGLPDSIRGR